jgi:hypothetical protein
MQGDDQSSEQPHDRRMPPEWPASRVEVWLTEEARVGQAGNNQQANETRLMPACRAWSTI